MRKKRVIINYTQEVDVSFYKKNKDIIIGSLLGGVVGYFYWLYCGIYWGGYTLSSECWVNCIYGVLFGGLIVSLFQKK